MVGQAAMAYLNQREAVLGGYIVDTVPFFPAEDQEPLLREDVKAAASCINGCPGVKRGGKSPTPPKGAIHVLLYVATEESEHWLGESPEEDIAEQVNK